MKNGKEKFIDHNHNLLFFKTRKKNNFLNIDQHKLGKNSFAKIKNFKTFHSASCVDCGSSFDNNQGFICLTCNPGIYLLGGYHDYWNKCIEHKIKYDDLGKKSKKKFLY